MIVPVNYRGDGSHQLQAALMLNKGRCHESLTVVNVWNEFTLGMGQFSSNR